MNRRIRKKRSALLAVEILAIPRTLSRARESFYALPMGTARHALYRAVRRAYADSPAMIRRAIWRRFAEETGR